VQADRYPDVATFMRFADSLASGLKALPGVESVAFSNVLPLSGMNTRRDFSIVGRPPLANADVPGAQVRYVSEQYFKALRIRIKQGTDFPERARLDTRRVTIVDQALAQRFFGERSPVGSQLDTDGTQWEIIGVAADVKYDKLDDPPTPTLYLPLGQMPADNVGFMANRFSLVMRTATDPASFARPLKRVLHSVDPDVPASAVRPLTEWIGDSLAPRRLVVVLITLFGVASLGLAILGVYGLLAQGVTQRTQEFGIRMAVGARPREVFLSTLREGMRLAAFGLAGGLCLAWGFGRVTHHFLYGIGAADPRMIAAALIIMFAVAVLASALPARRASRLSPMVAMRSGEG
jgi:predicted permease